MGARLKRIYDPPADDDGYRVLVDRLWPRGISKNAEHNTARSLCGFLGVAPR